MPFRYHIPGHIIGVALETAVADIDGVIRLNKETNREHADIIETNFESVGKVGKDQIPKIVVYAAPHESYNLKLC